MKHRLKRLSRTTLVAFGTVAIAALAWFAAGVVEGTGTTHTGKGRAIPIALTVTESPNEGLVPVGQGTEGGYTENQLVNAAFINANGVFQISGYQVTVTTSNETECKASEWIRIIGGEGVNGEGEGSASLTYSSPLHTVKHGEEEQLPDIADLRLQPHTGTEEAPAGCESVELKIHVVAQTKG